VSGEAPWCPVKRRGAQVKRRWGSEELRWCSGGRRWCSVGCRWCFGGRRWCSEERRWCPMKRRWHSRERRGAPGKAPMPPNPIGSGSPPLRGGLVCRARGPPPPPLRGGLVLSGLGAPSAPLLRRGVVWGVLGSRGWRCRPPRRVAVPAASVVPRPRRGLGPLWPPLVWRAFWGQAPGGPLFRWASSFRGRASAVHRWVIPLAGGTTPGRRAEAWLSGPRLLRRRRSAFEASAGPASAPLAPKRFWGVCRCPSGWAPARAEARLVARVRRLVRRFSVRPEGFPEPRFAEARQGRHGPSPPRWAGFLEPPRRFREYR
jgi:hypothetical protein